jgi:hypothetical protein
VGAQPEITNCFSENAAHMFAFIVGSEYEPDGQTWHRIGLEAWRAPLSSICAQLPSACINTLANPDSSAGAHVLLKARHGIIHDLLVQQGATLDSMRVEIQTHPEKYFNDPDYVDLVHQSVDPHWYIAKFREGVVDFSTFLQYIRAQNDESIKQWLKEVLVDHYSQHPEIINSTHAYNSLLGQVINDGPEIHKLVIDVFKKSGITEQAWSDLKNNLGKRKPEFKALIEAAESSLQADALPRFKR